MRRARVYFPIIGGLLALLLVASYQVLAPLLGINVSVCLIIIANLLLTGALHQDGLADTLDGFYGGQQPTDKLRIMKESAIGTYGTCAVVMILLSQFMLLVAVAEYHHLELVLLVAFALSRAMAISHVQDMPYLSGQSGKPSKSQALSNKFTTKQFGFVLLTGGLPLIFLSAFSAVIVLLGCFILRSGLKRWMTKHIGGYTGDCLGAAQQLQELLIYVLILATLHNTTA
jgi:adenosylcobinamide-GDP ribazoletransferase